MWLGYRHAGSSGAVSATSTSPRPRHSSCSRFSITRRKVWRGVLKQTSPNTSGSPAVRSTRRRRDFGTWELSLSTSQVGKVERLATDSATSRTSRNMSCQTTCRRGSTCRITGATSTSSTCRPIGLEGVNTHVGRVRARVRALPGARRSLRSLRVITEPSTDSLLAGRRVYAATFPLWGRRGRRPETVGIRKVTLIGWSLLRRLPASLAWTTKRISSPRDWVAVEAPGQRVGMPSATTVRARVRSQCPRTPCPVGLVEGAWE